MKKFLVIYHAPIEATAQMSKASPEEQQKGMEAWMQWAQQCGSKLTDLGAPLMGGKEIGPDGSMKESSRQVAGYSVLQADSIDEARELLKGHPHISGWHPQATIEIHEFMPLPGM
jgi:hypothetical protein